MKDRPYLQMLIQWALTAGTLFLGLRFGVPIPPPPAPPVIADPVPIPPPHPHQPNIGKAIGRIQFGTAGCTATPIGKHGTDGRYHIVTASHCVTAVGQRGQFRAQDGSTLSVTVQALDRKSDCAWLISDSTNLELPFGEMAEHTPPAGSRVWHAGYGVDRPGNREDGTYVSGPDSNGQLKFNLSVSSGDSGGAIVDDGTGRVVSVVCCTAGMARKTDVWGASPEAIDSLRRTLTDDWVWQPLTIPQRKDGEKK